jgi:multisubunit Na+/H+ antiporter MnhB subunit
MALFVAFGLVAALIWARLGAPDLALAEAAIGAGLTGVLLLHAARQLPAETTPVKKASRQFISPLLFVFVAITLSAGHILTDEALDLSAQPGAVLDSGVLTARLADDIQRALPDSGVEHPVTAVLLNFRAWDTLLELLVLVLALAGVRQLYSSTHTNQTTERQSTSVPQPWPLLLAWARFLAPLLVLTGGYLLWRGADAPGGAFQAGALLAAAAVLLRLSGLLPALRWSSPPVRLAINIGALVFLSVAALTLLLGDGWLTYPLDQAYMLIVAIELVATLSIAITLTLLVIGEHEDLHT